MPERFFEKPEISQKIPDTLQQLEVQKRINLETSISIVDKSIPEIAEDYISLKNALIEDNLVGKLQNQGYEFIPSSFLEVLVDPVEYFGESDDLSRIIGQSHHKEVYHDLRFKYDIDLGSPEYDNKVCAAQELFDTYWEMKESLEYINRGIKSEL